MSKRVIEIVKDEKASVEVETPKKKDEARKAILMAYRDQNPHKFLAKGLNEELTNLG